MLLSQVSVKEMQQQFKDARKQMEEDEDLAILMNGLRGTNLNEDDFAASAVKMRLIEQDFSNEGDGEGLPLVYVAEHDNNAIPLQPHTTKPTRTTASPP